MLSNRLMLTRCPIKNWPRGICKVIVAHMSEGKDAHAEVVELI